MAKTHSKETPSQRIDRKVENFESELRQLTAEQRYTIYRMVMKMKREREREVKS